MRAMFADQSVPPLSIAINHQFFPENLHRLDRLFLGEFTGGGNRVPVAPQQLPTRCATADLRKENILFVRQHSPSILAILNFPSAILVSAYFLFSICS